MTESNPTQVILTDDGIKIIKAQNAADNATSGVTDLNDPNSMSVIEKQTAVSQYAGLTSQYNVILARAKDDNISTTDLTTAYTNLNNFMEDILTDTTKASDVDRNTYKSLTDDYNMALSNVQTALGDSYNADIDNMHSSVSVASQAASSAVIVASQATVTGNNASQVASQALTAANQAQSAGNNANSVANNASQAASNAVIAGSQATVIANKASTAASQAQTAGDNATIVANKASQAASSAILAGSTATVSANKASADYQTLSAGVKDGSVVHITTETVIDKGVIGTAEIANGAITNAQIGNASISSAKIANLAVGTAQIGDGAITNAKIGKLAVGTAQIANGAITNAQIGSLAVGTAQIKDEAVNSSKIAKLAVGTAQIGDGAITNAKIGNLAVGTAQIANAAITDAQVGNVSANKLTAGTIDFNTITGKNINASNITTGTLSTDRLNVGKLSALSADLGNVTTGSLKGVNIVAKTFSTPNGSFTTDSNGAITAKDMTLIGGTLTSPTINASTINGSTISGTTFHGGDIISNANNTSQFYPTTISSDGHIYTTRFSSSDAMQTDLSTGSLTTKYRAVNSTSNNQYEAYDTLLEANQIVLSAGHTNGKDMSFSQSVSGNNRDGYVLISPLDGITLHGDHQWLRFNGYTSDTNPSGIVMTPWGNINPQGNQTDWYVGNKNTDKTAQFGIDSGHQVTINLFRATFVDEIGAMGNRLTNGRLLLHAVDGNAQMYLLNDGSPAFVSPTIYNRTYSYGANVHITSYGRIGRSTSASKYKLAIARSDDTLQADRLMTLKPASWNDKVATEKMAESLSNGEIPVEEEINLKRHYGLIAEDLRDAGLDEFLITGKDGQIEGIEYDRLWTVLIPKIKQLNNRINELERKTL